MTGILGNPLFIEGYLTTLALTAGAMLASLFIGTLVASLRVWGGPIMRSLTGTYVEFFRNTPLLVQLFFLYFATPFIGIYLGEPDTFGFRAAALGLTLYHAAYVAEIVRGGLLAVDKGQIEAARSLGLSYLGMLREVQLPQTFRAVIPPLGNIAIALVKNTSLAATIGVADLLFAGDIVESRTFRAEEAYAAVAVLYLSLTIPLGLLVNYLEKRMIVAR